MKNKKLQNQPLQKSVFSYYTKGRESLALQKKQHSFLPKSFSGQSLTRLLVAMLAVGMFGCLTWLTSKPIFRLPNGVEPLRSTEAYEATITKLLSGSLLNHSKLTIRAADIEAKVLAAYPEIQSTKVHVDFIGQRPVIKLVYRTPVWRVLSKGQTWLVDKDGIAMGTTASGLREQSQLPLLEDTIGLSAKAGSHLLAPSDVTFLRLFTAYMTAKSIKLQKYSLPLVPRELDVQLAGDAYIYKLNLDDKVEAQAGSLMAARDTFNTSADKPTQYVDLRASEKAFWK